MTPDQVRKIVQQELRSSKKSDRFGYQNIPNHVHNGKDSPSIRDTDLARNPAVLGSVTFATEGQTYTFEIDMPQTPRRISCNGIVFNSTVRVLTIGEAYLGEGYYLQPLSDNSVQVGDIRYPAATEQPDGTTKNVPLQCSSWFWADEGDQDEYKVLVSENHLVSVGFGGTIYARLTVVDFSKDKIVFSVPYLESGYEIIANFLITWKPTPN